MNRDELRKKATELKIPGRSKMTVEELREAIEAVEVDKAITNGEAWDNEGGAPAKPQYNRAGEAARRVRRGW